MLLRNPCNRRSGGSKLRTSTLSHRVPTRPTNRSKSSLEVQYGADLMGGLDVVRLNEATNDKTAERARKIRRLSVDIIKDNARDKKSEN